MTQTFLYGMVNPCTGENFDFGMNDNIQFIPVGDKESAYDELEAGNIDVLIGRKYYEMCLYSLISLLSLCMVLTYDKPI